MLSIWTGIGCARHLLRPNGCMDQDVTWYGAVPRSRRLWVRWGPRSPLQKGGRAPSQFSVNVYCGQTAGRIKMVLGIDIGLSSDDFVLDGDPAPSTKKGRSPLHQKGAEPPPKFSAHFHCGPTAGCIKMPLGMEVGQGHGASEVAKRALL